MQLDMFLKEILLRENLVTIAVDSGKVTSVNFNTEIYSEFIKDLYCPKMYDPSKLKSGSNAKCLPADIIIDETADISGKSFNNTFRRHPQL
jgi:hypothetical protein